MLNVIAVSTSARLAVAEFCDELLEAEQAWQARLERLEQNLHDAEAWTTLDRFYELGDDIALEQVEMLEKIAEEAQNRLKTRQLEARELLNRLEAYISEHPNDWETIAFYSDIYKDEYGIRPHWKLAQWWTHGEE